MPFLMVRFHGMYQQDDRDIRAERPEQKLEPLHNVMLRARMPGGIIKPEQWLAIDKFASEKTLYGSISDQWVNTYVKVISNMRSIPK